MDSLSATSVNARPEAHPGFWMRFFGAAWYMAAAVAVAILLASIPGYLSEPYLGVFEDRVVIGQDFTSQALVNLSFFLSFASGLISIILAGWLYVKKSREPIGLFLAYHLLAHGIIFGGSFELLSWFWPAAPWVNSFLLLPIFNGPLTIALVAIFPDGRFVPRWSVWLIPFSALGTLLAFFQLGFVEVLDGPVQFDFTQFLTGFFTLTVLLGSIYVQVYRYRRVSTPRQRRQTRWVLYGLVLWFVVIGFSSIPWSRALTLPAGSPLPRSVLLGTVGWTASSFFLPVTLAIAVLREGLFEIDVLINRSLVYALLTAIVVAIYILIVGALSALFQARDNLLISMIATGVVAVLFQPLREALQLRVNRLMFGQRDDPVRVLNRLGEQIETHSALEELLGGLLETVVDSLRLPYAAIELEHDGEVQLAASAGRRTTSVARVQLVSQGARLGTLLVGERGPGNTFTSDERRLLENIARQTGTAIHAGQLLLELQRSRQQIVTAREEERRRLRRDLHDGIGPTMASQTLKLDAALDLIAGASLPENPGLEKAGEILLQLKHQTQETVKSIRQIVYELRPPALDNLGLVQALQLFIGSQERTPAGPQVTLEVDEDLPVLPAAVEVAVYRIVLEALTNVLQHARAKHCVVQIALGSNGQRWLQVEVCDDGAGFKADKTWGVGLTSMRERSEELGGRFSLDSGAKGTTIRARIPFSKAEED